MRNMLQPLSKDFMTRLALKPMCLRVNLWVEDRLDFATCRRWLGGGPRSGSRRVCNRRSTWYLRIVFLNEAISSWLWSDKQLVST